MKKITDKKSQLINMIYSISIFLAMGVLRPLIVYFFNLDLFVPIIIIISILLLLIRIFTKEQKFQRRNIFESSESAFNIVSILFIMKNESSIVTPILAIITSLLIILVYNKKFKNSKLMKPTSYVVVIGIFILLFIYITPFYNQISNTYNTSNGYKECSIVDDLPIPINARERSYKIDIENIEKSTGYRIQNIGLEHTDKSSYIEVLEQNEWKVDTIEKTRKVSLYKLSKGLKTVIIEIKNDSLIIGIEDEYKSDTYIKEKISSMSLDEKIGQMIVSGFDGKEANLEISMLTDELKVGGVILFGRNIENSNQLKKLNEDIKKSNENIEMFISIDEEGGRVSRLPKDTNKFESSKEIGQKKDIKYAYENGKNIGETLYNHNFNMDFAPVLDIYSNPKNTVIGDRAFGSDEKIVSSMGIATMNGIKSSGIIPVTKHFPGHGDTDVDSHFGLPIVSKSLNELEKFEFIPFKKSIDEGCDVIMVSHIILESIDNKNPSTLSEKVVKNILREDLNFNGVIITDDMHMKAITDNMTIEKASVKSIKSGVDIILIGSDVSSTKSTIKEIKRCVENNEISENRIDESVYRILKVKSAYGLKI